SLQWAKPTSAPPPLAAHRTSCGEKMRRMPLFYVEKYNPCPENLQTVLPCYQVKLLYTLLRG
ncbi:MAG: hypothetical protein FWF79_01845, partial [Defluviitaleaceae bacterium]|nr:hypothetical protein [Defluviitaleaceae bacterium]